MRLACNGRQNPETSAITGLFIGLPDRARTYDILSRFSISPVAKYDRNVFVIKCWFLGYLQQL
jgi:hypothetical protein